MQKFKIKANINELESIGIYYDITGLKGTLVKTYSDGWIILNITYYTDGIERINDFDIPKYMCEPIKEQFAVYEKEPRHGKNKNGIILAPYNTKKEAEIAGEKYGYCGDNYYVDSYEI